MNVLLDMSHIIDHDISTHLIVWTPGVEGDTFLHQLPTILESG